MKNLTLAETEQVSGGVFRFLVGYFGPKLLDATLHAASNVHDMYQNENRFLPYNRL